MQPPLISTLLLMTISFTAFGQANTVSLYDQCNYSGKKFNLGVGNHWGYQMKIGNDKLASLKIPAGMKVTLYEHDKFQGKSVTYTQNINCLPAEWIKNTSSIVVESKNPVNPPTNDYITFFNDCYGKGYSQSLVPGTYTGIQLGALKNNISSFTIHGNLRVKVYINNDNLSGYSVLHNASVSCLGSNQNDKISSLVIDYKPYQTNNSTSGSVQYATIYVDCNYGGNSLRLSPGHYPGDKLGLFRYNISSIEIPSNLKARVFVNNENLGGNSYTIRENINCLAATMNNKIGSVIIEEDNAYDPYNPPVENRVVLFTDANYKGETVSLLPGTYSSLAQAGFYNDALSSLTIPPGFRVVLYENENLKGKSFTLTASRSVFTLTGWNDRASSIAIYRQ